MNNIKIKESSATMSMVFMTTRFLTVLYCVLLLEFSILFVPQMQLYDFKTCFFAFSVALTYPLLYMSPCIILIFLMIYLSTFIKENKRIKTAGLYCLLVLLAGLQIFYLFADYKIYSMFKFHINGFVLNLLFTPGGIESMGASVTDNIVFGLLITGCLTFTALLLWGVHITRKKQLFPLKTKIIASATIFSLLVTLGVAEKFEYAYYNYKDRPEVFYNAQKVPLYIPTRMKTFYRSLKIPEGRRDNLKYKQYKTALHYPLKPIKLDDERKKYNIVWLVAESWRADTLTPEIMPETSKFAKKCLYCHNHYSSGNGTRMALFGMFYGLYGSYWDAALSARRAPVIMQTLKEDNYQFMMYTSAKFTYPEFDKTIFANIDKKNLHQSAGRGGFINDRKNISSMLNDIKHRNKSRAFMAFMFFESPHAPYTFPENCIVKKDYLQTFNYSTVNIPENIEKIKNRYLNSVNHLDTQLARVFKFLEKEKLMDNTIVVVAGDHGEEFMEKGHWGHNKSFTEEQIRTPFMIYIPGQEPREVYFMTSHLDIAATIAPFIRIINPPKDFSLGYNLLNKSGKRQYTACASWNKLCYIDKKVKCVISASPYNTITTAKDAPLPQKEVGVLNQKRLFIFIKNAGTFFSK